MNKDHVFEIDDRFRIVVYEEEPVLYDVSTPHEETLTFTISTTGTIITSHGGTEVPAVFNFLQKLPHGERITLKRGDESFVVILNYGYDTDIIDEYVIKSPSYGWVQICEMAREGVLIRYTKQ